MQKAEGEANLNVQDHLNGDNDNGTNYPPPPPLVTVDKYLTFKQHAPFVYKRVNCQFITMTR